jgi:AcrR family transcriptional regulator
MSITRLVVMRWTLRPLRAEARTKDDRRRDLVLAAYHQIAERGFEGLRTREIAAEVGVNVATLHYYFPTKESLIRGVLDYAMGQFRGTLKPSGSAADELRNHLRGLRRLLIDEPQLGLVLGELTLRSVRDPNVAAAPATTTSGTPPCAASSIAASSRPYRSGCRHRRRGRRRHRGPPRHDVAACGPSALRARRSVVQTARTLARSQRRGRRLMLTPCR